MAAGILAAVGAFLCCITTVLALMASIGGVVFAFYWLDPLRPYLTGLVLAFAWYQQLKPRAEALVCGCEEKCIKSSLYRQTKSTNRQ
jgi:mercuric ion transport protein